MNLKHRRWLRRFGLLEINLGYDLKTGTMMYDKFLIYIFARNFQESQKKLRQTILHEQTHLCRPPRIAANFGKNELAVAEFCAPDWIIILVCRANLLVHVRTRISTGRRYLCKCKY